MALRNADDRGKLQTYSEDGYYVDLFDLCSKISTGDQFPAAVRDAASAVASRVDQMVVDSFGMSAYPGFEPGKNRVFLVVPTGEPEDWGKFKWYSPYPGEKKFQGNWAFLRVGATPNNGVVDNWFELCDAWFDQVNADGGVNGYKY